MGKLPQILLVAVLFVLSGCSYFFGDKGQFRERTMDYQRAKSIEPISLPEGMQANQIGQRYPIPEVGEGDFYVPEDSETLPRPHSLLNVDESAGLELREDGGEVWLRINQPVAEVWPRLLEFVDVNLFDVDYSDQSQGVIETGWLKPRRLDSDRGWWSSLKAMFSGGKKELRERFRFQVDPSDDFLGSIITINHVKVFPPLPEKVEWPAKPQREELVALVYDELMEFYSEGGRKVGASVLSQNLEALPEHSMTWDGNGLPILVVNQDFNHAWRDVGLALQKAKIEVLDLDRSLGIYYLDRKAKITDEDGDEVEKEVQMRLVSSESGIQVSVQLDDDTVAPKELSAQILLAVREKL